MLGFAFLAAALLAVTGLAVFAIFAIAILRLLWLLRFLFVGFLFLRETVHCFGNFVHFLGRSNVRQTIHKRLLARIESDTVEVSVGQRPHLEVKVHAINVLEFVEISGQLERTRIEHPLEPAIERTTGTGIPEFHFLFDPRILTDVHEGESTFHQVRLSLRDFTLRGFPFA